MSSIPNTGDLDSQPSRAEDRYSWGHQALQEFGRGIRQKQPRPNPLRVIFTKAPKGLALKKKASQHSQAWVLPNTMPVARHLHGRPKQQPVVGTAE